MVRKETIMSVSISTSNAVIENRVTFEDLLYSQAERSAFIEITIAEALAISVKDRILEGELYFCGSKLA